MYAYAPLVIGLLCLIATFPLSVARRRRHSRLPLPPKLTTSDRRFTASIKKQPYELFRQCSKELQSSLISFNVFWRRVIVINTIDAADALLTKQSARFSDRPDRVMLSLTGLDGALALLPKRRASSSSTSRAARDPERVEWRIHLAFVRMVLKWAIGYAAVDEDDALMLLSVKIGDNAAGLIGSSNTAWIEMFPIFKYVPTWLAGSEVSRIVSCYRQEIRTLFRWSEQHVSKELASDAPEKSFLVDMMQTCKTPYDRNIAQYAALSVMAGGYPAMISLCSTLLMAMLANPEAQRKAQDEIDAVAVVTEVLRWVPPIPLTSRYISTEEEFEGYTLPKNTTIVANVWAMTREEDRFPRPDSFIPERYIPDWTIPLQRLRTTACSGEEDRVWLWPPITAIASAQAILRRRRVVDPLSAILAVYNITSQDGVPKPENPRPSRTV
ncbi:cytochrome P450 [Epithele typhae]|uniref:cytochrome P450 n=1 Tax=Epithele typhae TaxID=378194 RepID=UPI002007AADC|nr:cytochrome P450 [Epithele typhae]KAH9929001.1 cytochrome P450 [Epithele typhae]